MHGKYPYLLGTQTLYNIMQSYQPDARSAMQLQHKSTKNMTKFEKFLTFPRPQDHTSRWQNN